MDKTVNQNYKYEGDYKLDMKNKILNHMIRAKKNRNSQNKQSFSTMDAQMKQIVQVLMT